MNTRHEPCVCRGMEMMSIVVFHESCRLRLRVGLRSGYNAKEKFSERERKVRVDEKCERSRKPKCQEAIK